MKISKRFKAIAAKVDNNKVYTIEEAVKLVRNIDVNLMLQ
jgi:ribosomal protein L1